MKIEKIYIDLDTNDISPTLIRSYVYNLDCEDWIHEPFDERYIEHYEFEYIIKSDGSMIHEGKHYPLKPGDLCFKRPGEKTQGFKPYSCYTAIFKMTNKEYQTPYQPYYRNEILDRIPSVYQVKNYKYFEMLFKMILDEYIKETESSAIKIKSYLLDIIFTLYEEIKENYLPSSPYYGKISKAIEFIEKNYHNKILLEDIADYVDSSPFYFHTIFKQTMGITPNEYLMKYRINYAKQLLLLTNDSITDIAIKSGFGSSSYFCYCFRKYMHTSPHNYRKLHKIS